MEHNTSCSKFSVTATTASPKSALYWSTVCIKQWINVAGWLATKDHKSRSRCFFICFRSMNISLLWYTSLFPVLLWAMKSMQQLHFSSPGQVQIGLCEKPVYTQLLFWMESWGDSSTHLCGCCSYLWAYPATNCAYAETRKDTHSATALQLP